ncbi:endonuclease/exonuclease/phosphatase family protein [Antrihabitans cavernicola]|uniref:Endonuclease/exonuclease/phosphatase family protein n=1 Tax=Antrihabitans cavernicola TaxID=2495913 RepID=A0A5A7SCT4_9NOCA|nr:endonuclease/exonuclease/phosphatase family protein [Spelaeibacter cavernicola]
MRVGLAVLGSIALVLGCVGIALHWSRSQRYSFVLASSGAVMLTCAAVIALILFAAARSWVGIAAAGLAIGAGIWTQLPLYVADGAPADGSALTVMQSNILFGTADADAMVREVRERRVDVLTVEELTPEAVARLGAAGLDALLPFHHLQPDIEARGTGIWARYPLRDPKTYSGFPLHQVSATMDIPGGTPTTVFAFHPVPPWPSGPDVWGDQMRRLQEIMASAGEGPAIVGGDFNATYDHAVFRNVIAGRFADAADQAGAGILPTYPADRWWPPVIAIDHILVAGGRADHVDTVTIPGSDHRSVVAQIRMNRVSG